MPGHNDWYHLSSDGDFKFVITQKANHVEFHQAALDAARLIYQRYRNPHVCLSGGNDSRFVVECFLQQGLEPKIIIVDCEINRSDVELALGWCEEKGLHPNLIEISKEEYIDFSFKINWERKTMYRWGFYPLIAEQFFPTADLITGYEDPFECDLDGILKDEIVIEQGAFFLGARHPSAFFAYTPELFLSVIREIDYSLTQSAAKAKLYHVPDRGKISFDSDVSYKTFGAKFLGKRIKDRRSKHVLGTKDEVIQMLASS